MRKVVCAKCGSDDINITECMNPNDDNTIREYFTTAYESDGGSCFCNTCMDHRDFRVIEGECESESDDPWRCEECGSLDVQQQAWMDPTTGKVVSYNDCDRDDFWCERCEEHCYIVRESYLMEETVDKWFSGGLQPEDEEVISGLNRNDFASDEEFEAACKEVWNEKTNQEKIDIWHELTRDKSNDK